MLGSILHYYALYWQLVISMLQHSLKIFCVHICIVQPPCASDVLNACTAKAQLTLLPEVLQLHGACCEVTP